MYRQAAEQGYAEAQFNLGVMYDNGQGAKQDHAEAVRLYREAAEQGCAEAQFILGVMYDNGKGVRHQSTMVVPKGIRSEISPCNKSHA